MNEFRTQVPEGQHGNWRIERFAVSESQASIDAMRGIMHGGRFTPAGTYTRFVSAHTNIYIGMVVIVHLLI